MTVTPLFTGKNRSGFVTEQKGADETAAQITKLAEVGRRGSRNVAELRDNDITPESEAAAVAAVRQKRVDDALAAAENADPKSDAFTVGSVYKACVEAHEGLTGKRKELEATGDYTEAGIRKQLMPEAKRLVAHLKNLNDTVVASRLDTIEAKQKAIVEKSAAPLMEPTEEDTLLATNYAALPAEKQREYLRNALAGNDPKLARALAMAHPLVADIHEDNRKLLVAKVTGRSSAEHVALESQKAQWHHLTDHLSFTVDEIGSLVEVPED